MDTLAKWLLLSVISRLAFLSNLFMVFLADRGTSSLCQGLPRRMKYDSAKKRWFMPNVAKINIKRRTARQALLFGVNSIYRLMWECLVEARRRGWYSLKWTYGCPCHYGYCIRSGQTILTLFLHDVKMKGRGHFSYRNAPPFWSQPIYSATHYWADSSRKTLLWHTTVLPTVLLSQTRTNPSSSSWTFLFISV